MNWPSEEEIELLHDSCEGRNTYKTIEKTIDLIKAKNPEERNDN